MSQNSENIFRMAHPWWVNLLFVIPFASYFYWRKRPLSISWIQLMYAALFAAAFGVVEGVVVVYLRSATGVAANYGNSILEARRFAESFSPSVISAGGLTVSLIRTETYREAATIIMLVSVAALAARTRSGRWAIFLWIFAIWDLSYYATLFAIIGWPSSVSTLDILFLIPVPWISAVWFPLLVSTLSAIAVALSCTKAQTR